MKRITRHPMDDESKSNSYYLEIAQRMVDLINENPYSRKINIYYEYLNECGEILRYRILHPDFIKEHNKKCSDIENRKQN